MQQTPVGGRQGFSMHGALIIGSIVVACLAFFVLRRQDDLGRSALASVTVRTASGSTVRTDGLASVRTVQTIAVPAGKNGPAHPSLLPAAAWSFPQIDRHGHMVILTVSNQGAKPIDVTVRGAGTPRPLVLRMHVPARSSAETDLSNVGAALEGSALHLVATGPILPRRWVIGGRRTIAAYGNADPIRATFRPLASSNPTLASRLNAAMLQFVKRNGLTGSVLVVQKRRSVLSSAYGFANRAQRVSNQTTTVYPIRGLTTDFTAVAILQLQDRGKLSVNNGMCRYLPVCPPRLRAITIGQLLSHTSGLPRNTLDVRRPFTIRQLLTSYAGAPVRFKPGTKWLFSDTGYVLLGAIIERVSGMPYRTFIHRSILTPLGMTHSGFLVEQSHLPLALGYHGTTQITRSAGPSYQPAWGMYSTVIDLEKFNEGLNSRRIISRGSKAAMFAPRIRFSNGVGYGYAWNSGFYRGHRFNVAYGDLTPGYASVMIRLPQDNIRMIMLSNQDEAPVTQIVSTFLKTVYPK